MSLGLRTIGVLGILLDAKGQGLVGAIKPLIGRLKVELQFFVSDKLERQVLAAAGE